MLFHSYIQSYGADLHFNFIGAFENANKVPSGYPEDDSEIKRLQNPGNNEQIRNPLRKSVKCLLKAKFSGTTG